MLPDDSLTQLGNDLSPHRGIQVKCALHFTNQITFSISIPCLLYAPDRRQEFDQMQF